MNHILVSCLTIYLAIAVVCSADGDQESIPWDEYNPALADELKNQGIGRFLKGREWSYSGIAPSDEIRDVADAAQHIINRERLRRLVVLYRSEFVTPGERSGADFWEEYGNYIGWIIVYLGEEAEPSEAVFSVLDELAYMFPDRKVDGNICFSYERDQVRDFYAKTATQRFEFNWSRGRPVPIMVDIARNMIKKRAMSD